MEYHIVPVDGGNAQDYLEFFDNRAFCDNPDWAGCYCAFNHYEGDMDQWIARTAKDNRADAEKMIFEGRLKGFLSYVSGRVVGWCNVNDKHVYPQFSKVGEDGNSRVCAVTCFVIDPDYRRQGVARALLQRACEDYAAEGYDFIEGYPMAREGSCAAHYHGHPAMYEKEGFAVHMQLEDRLCMRKPLKGETV